MESSGQQRGGPPSTLGLLLSGGPGFAQIAITNVCNARCDFCSFAVGKLEKAHFRSATYEGVRDACDVLFDKGIRYLTFTGGEPMAHPRLLDMIAYAAAKRMNPVLVTNGSLLDDRACEDLAERGVQNVVISVDSEDEATHDLNRGFPGLWRRIGAANRRLGDLGIARTASVTVSRLVRDYAALPAALEGLGFDNLTFSYPLTALHSTYLSYSSSKLVEYGSDELVERFREIQRLKPRFPIMNPTESLNEMIRHLRKEKSRFPCLAGHKYFFVDWKLDVYRCHYFETPICSIYEFRDAAPIRDHCDLCMIDCYRDPSVLQYSAVALSDALGHLRRGRPLRAAGALFDRRTLDSLRAVGEGMSWLTRWKRKKRPAPARSASSSNEGPPPAGTPRPGDPL